MATLIPLPSAIWGRTPPEARAYIETLIARVAVLEAAVKALTERLQQDSTNASRPPSSDRPSKKGGQKRRQPRGRRPGGQPGHPGHTREWIPVEDVDRVIVLKPVSCGRCDHEWSGTDPQPHRHQMIDIAPMRPVVYDYQVHRLTCEGCGATTYGSWPQGVPTSMMGPLAQAIVALCTGAYRLSKHPTQQVLAGRFGLSLSVGTIRKLESATTALLEAPLEETRADVQDQASAHLAETGWRRGHQRAWVWVATTTWVTVFLVRLSRGSQVAKALLGERFSGILVTDRWRAYTWYRVRWRQWCWAHLLRDFEAMMGRGGRSQEIGEGLKSQAEQMCHEWHRVRDGTLARSSFRSSMTRVCREVERLLEAGSCCEGAKTEGMCRDIVRGSYGATSVLAAIAHRARVL